MSHKLTIFSVYHGLSTILKSSIITPIQVGRIYATQKLDMIGDDTGDNISALNPFFCESTAMYWVWKNMPPSEYVGFCHYRRFFYTKEYDSTELDDSLFLHRPYFDDDLKNSIGLDDNYFEKLLDSYDAILPLKIPMQLWGSRNIIDQVGTIPQLNYSLYNMTPLFERSLEFLKDMYPDLSAEIDTTMHNQDYGYFYNIFILKKEIFQLYCNWLFPFLLKFHDEVDYSEFSQAEMRALAFFVERYFNVFINWQKRIGSINNIKEIPVVMVDKPEMITELSTYRSYNENITPVICTTASDLSFEKTLLTIESISLLPEPQTYKLIIVDQGLSSANKKRLTRIFQAFHVNASFVMLALPKKYNISFIPTILAIIHSLNEDHIIFVKSGSLIIHDVFPLFNTIKEKTILATQNVDIYAQIKTKQLILGMEAREFIHKYICGGASDNCFSSDFLVMNLKKMHGKEILNRMDSILKSFEGKNISEEWVLNILFDSKWDKLGFEWACSAVQKNIEMAPLEVYKQYNFAAQNPAVITLGASECPITENSFAGSPVEGALLHYLRSASLGAAFILPPYHLEHTLKLRVEKLELLINCWTRFVAFIARIPFAKKIYHRLAQ